MEYRWSHEFHPKSPILNFKFTDVTNLSVYIKSTVPKGKVHVNQLDSLQVKYPFQAHHLAFTEEPGAARGQSVLALLPKRRFHTGISKLSKSSPQVQVLLMLWERKKKLLQLIKIHHMLTLSYVGSSKVILVLLRPLHSRNVMK